MNHSILKNLTVADLPSSWVKQLDLSHGQRFTVHIVVQTDSNNHAESCISAQTERIALMRSIEQQLQGSGNEDSEDWIQWIKESRTVSKPTQVF